jgi:hypothetical protein
MNTKFVGRLGLSDEEENALVSFMQTLTDGFMQWRNAPRRRCRCGVHRPQFRIAPQPQHRHGGGSLLVAPMRTWRKLGSPFAGAISWTLANMNKRGPAAPSLFGRKPERNSSVSATFNVRGLRPSRPDSALSERRHPDRLLVSLHRTVVSRLPRA